MTDALVTDRLGSDSDIFLASSRFLALEAKLLDERRFDEWYELMDDDVLYVVPIRVGRMDFGDEVRGNGHIIHDTKRRLKVRVDRINCGECWSETPPSRTVRVIGSILTERTDRSDVIKVESAMLLYRQRNSDLPGDILPVRRSDMLRFGADGPRLLERRALLADTTLRSPNLGIFV